MYRPKWKLGFKGDIPPELSTLLPPPKQPLLSNIGMLIIAFLCLGIVVARQFERIFLVARGDQGELGVLFQRAHDVAQLAVNFCRKRRFRKAWPDIRRNLRRSSAGCHFAHAAVGKGDLDHLGHGFRSSQSLSKFGPGKRACRPSSGRI